jgi:hypothetical protein
VLVVVIAALLGILILKNGFDSSASVDTGGSGPSTTIAAATSTTIATTTTTVSKASFTVLTPTPPAGRGSRAPDREDANRRFLHGAAGDATAKADTTKVYYLSGYEAAAASVASYSPSGRRSRCRSRSGRRSGAGAGARGGRRHRDVGDHADQPTTTTAKTG